MPGFEVDVFLDRAGEGNKAPLYRVGEPVRVDVDVSSSGWVTDATRYWVGERPQRAQFGTLAIRSDPERADAYVNGSFVGYTPVEYEIGAGRYRVEVMREGFRTYDATVELEGGETRALHVDLDRVAQPDPQPPAPERGERLFDAPDLYAPAGMRITEIEREDGDRLELEIELEDD